MAVHQLGNWVRSYSQGIWQIVRVLPEHFLPRYSLDSPKVLNGGTLYCVKRLVTDKWKRSLSMEFAHAVFIKTLSVPDQKSLDDYIRDHPRDLEAFTKYNKPPDLVLNLGFSLPQADEGDSFARWFQDAFRDPLADGVSSDDILNIILNSPYASHFSKNPRFVSLQFVCKGHEIKDRECIYRKMNVLNF